MNAARHIGRVALFAAVVTSSWACTEPTAAPSDAGSDAEPMALYALYCQGCHGAEGSLGPAPPLDDALLFAIASDRVLHDVIAHGRPPSMPAFEEASGGPLSDAEIDALIDAMRGKWAARAQDPRVDAMARYFERAELRGLMPGGDPAAGRAAYHDACASCHGARGEGVAGHGSAISDPAYLALTPNADLRRMIITGRADLDMPSFLSKEGRSASFSALEPKDVEDIVAFIDTWRTGSTETPSTRAEP